jgi:hypothetical protein
MVYVLNCSAMHVFYFTLSQYIMIVQHLSKPELLQYRQFKLFDSPECFFSL